MDNPKYEPHFHGQVQGVVIGDNNTVTFIFQSGKQHTVPFLAPPRPPYDLVGRDKLLRDLKQRLFAGCSLPLCALNGLPGVGKTALAVELAHDRDVLEHFQDGVLWAGLGFRAEVLSHLSEWSAALGIPSDEIAMLTGIEDRAKAIHAAIGMRRMLLIADDAWQPEAALAFKLGGPNCAHLVTTRLPEVALRFAGDGAKVVQELSEPDALTLLARLAPEVLEAEPDDARELVRAVGGLPLALILMGNYLRIQAHSGQPRRLRAALDKLRQTAERLQLAEPQAPAERHPSLPEGARVSLQAVIGISDEALDGESRRSLRALSVFPPKPNTFSEESALAVSTAATKTLDTLTDYGLLESSGKGRYTLHQTISDYARLKLTDTAVYERMAEYFLRVIEEADKELNTAEHRLGLDRIELELDNIRTGMNWAVNVLEHRMSARYAVAFHLFLEQRGLWDELEDRLKSGEISARIIKDNKQLGFILRNLGTIYWHRSDWTKSIRYFTNAVEMFSDLNDLKEMAILYNNLGLVYWNQGEYSKAIESYKESLELHRKQRNWKEVATVLNNFGLVCRDMDDYPRAVKRFKSSFRFAKKYGHLLVEVTALHHLGTVAQKQKNLKAAKKFYEQSLKGYQEKLKHPEGEAKAFQCLGSTAYEQENFLEAIDFYKKSLKMTSKLKDNKQIAETMYSLCMALRKMRRINEAVLLCTKAYSLYRNLRMPEFEKVGKVLTQLKDELGEEHFTQFTNEAENMTLDEALNLALSGETFDRTTNGA